MGMLESLSLCAKEQPVLAQHGQQRALPHRADCSRLGLKEQGCMEAGCGIHPSFSGTV